MIKLTKSQSEKIGEIVIERDKQGIPVLIIKPVQISDDEYILNDDYKDLILEKTDIKRNEIEEREYTKEEIDQKQEELFNKK